MREHVVRVALWAMFAFLGVVHAQGEADGAALYATYCSGCHQAAGTGIPSVFPPLAGHVGNVVQAEGGRRHLANVLLFGMQGPITINGATYNGFMPAWSTLSNDDLAAILNHVLTAWGDAADIPRFETYTANEIQNARGAALSPDLVYQRRPDMEAAAATRVLPLASFTVEQAERVLPTYRRLCLECHGDDYTGGLIGGPPLVGSIFLTKWGGSSVASFFTYLRTQMPQGAPDSISAQAYADLVALILRVNGHEAGATPLTPDLDALERVGIRRP
jgi:mono/diheme cytochrome c family protein